MKSCRNGGISIALQTIKWHRNHFDLRILSHRRQKIFVLLSTRYNSIRCNLHKLETRCLTPTWQHWSLLSPLYLVNIVTSLWPPINGQRSSEPFISFHLNLLRQTSSRSKTQASSWTLWSWETLNTLTQPTSVQQMWRDCDPCYQLTFNNQENWRS